MAWAKAARLVRVTGTRLVPVKKNAALADRPLDLVLALLEAYRRLGVVVLDREAGTAGLTDLGRYAIRRVRGMTQPGDRVFQVRVTLADVDDPPVWRRVLIPASYSLDRCACAIRAPAAARSARIWMARGGRAAPTPAAKSR